MDLVQIDEQYMLVVECMFSRFAETVLLPDKQAETVYKACCELLFDRHGIPELIRTDNGKEFTGLGAASFQLGFEWRRCSPHNPQSQGMIERANRSILNEITKLRAGKGYAVEDARRVGTSLYNTRTHSATGKAPYFVVFGREWRDPDLVIEQKKHANVNLKSKIALWVAARAERDRLVYREAAETDQRQKINRGEQRDVERFRVGDFVLLPKVNKTNTDLRKQGPYEVVQVRAGNTYRLKDVHTLQQRFPSVLTLEDRKLHLCVTLVFIYAVNNEATKHNICLSKKHFGQKNAIRLLVCTAIAFFWLRFRVFAKTAILICDDAKVESF
jgi:hypothetical protein